MWGETFRREAPCIRPDKIQVGWTADGYITIMFTVKGKRRRYMIDKESAAAAGSQCLQLAESCVVKDQSLVTDILQALIEGGTADGPTTDSDVPVTVERECSE